MLEILFVIAGLAFLVIIHEFGHFLAAKYFGLLVEEFGVGLPPRLWGRKIGETLYSLNWLPFGGFVRIFGENRSEQSGRAEEKNYDPTRLFYLQKIWKRFLVVAAGVVMNFFVPFHHMIRLPLDMKIKRNLLNLPEKPKVPRK